MPTLWLTNYNIRTAQTENFLIFNTRISSLSEVKELYNLSAINATWFDLRPLSSSSHWAHVGSDSLPKSVEALTMDLLLHSMKKQRVLESEVETLEREVGTQRQYVQFLAVGFAFMFVIVGVLWKRTTGISK